jgi:ADP-ribose pyrophosphatase
MISVHIGYGEVGPLNFERISSRTVYEGPLASARIDRFRYEDGAEAERQVIGHPGSVAIVAHDRQGVYLVRQPREAVGEPGLLELPAGTLDVEGEGPIDCARRELAEEVGLSAAHWQPMRRIYTSPGFLAETVHLFEATELTDRGARPDEGERIKVVKVALGELAEALERILDAKTLVGLLMLQRRLES